MLKSEDKKRVTPGGMLEAWLAISVVVLVVGVFFVDGAQQRNVAIVAVISAVALVASVSQRRRQREP